MNARHIRAEQFVKEHFGKLDAALARRFSPITMTVTNKKSMPASGVCAAMRTPLPSVKKSGAMRHTLQWVRLRAR